MDMSQLTKRKFIIMVQLLLFSGMMLGFSSINFNLVNASTSLASTNNPEPGIPYNMPTDGTPVTLIPGKQLTLTTSSGLGIDLIVGDGVTIRIIESYNLPPQITSISDDVYGLGLYLDIELNDSSVDINATLSFLYDPSSLPTNVDVKTLYFAFFNVTKGEWQSVLSWVDTLENKVYANITHFSTWTIMAQIQLPIPIFPDSPIPGIAFEIPTNGTPVELIPGENLILTTPSGVSINLSVGESVTISIKETNSNPEGNLPENTTSLGIFLEIELNDSSVSLDATLAIPYTDSQLPSGITEDQLYFAFYNVTTGNWQEVSSWVDRDNNIVLTSTTHFSTWTVIVPTDSSDTISDKSSSLNPFQSLWLNTQSIKEGFLAITLFFSVIFAVALVKYRGKE
jgi:hypothetical protein